MGKTDSKEKLIQLIDRYKDLIFSVCLKMTGDYFTAEDITQETFILAYQHLNRFDGNNEKAWLCKIAANKCIDHLKAANKREVITLPDEMDAVSLSSGPENECINKNILEQLKNSCRSLPAPLHGLPGRSGSGGRRLPLPLRLRPGHRGGSLSSRRCCSRR